MNEANRYKTAICVAVPVLLALALGGVSLWASNATKKAAERESALTTQVQSAYRQAMYQLSDNINDMQTALKKLRVTGGVTQHVLLLSDVWRLSGTAVANLGALPIAHGEVADMNAFIVRTGDYARVLERKILDGGVLTGEDYDQLDKLYEASVQIGDQLSNRLQNDDFPLQSLDAEGYYGGAEDAPAAQPGQEEASGEEATGGAEGEKSQEGIADYPTLIYDGPFSESNEKPDPKGLPEGEVDENKAKELALAFLGGGELTPSGLEEGSIPVYGFFGTDKDGRAVEITVTRQGGAVLWMMAEVPFGEDGVPEEDAVKQLSDNTKQYLEQRGYEGMEPTYAQFYDGIGVFNFAATQNGVLLYPDLIKVYVEKATGNVAGVDANNYLMSHARRSLPAPAITEEEARLNVSDALDVASVRLALIPKTAATETLCYEFKGTCRGADFVVYIDASTGTEQEIFEIINSEEGQLVV